MTCSKRFGRLLQASSLGLIGMLAVVGCGGSDNTPVKKDASPAIDTGPGNPVAIVKVNPAILDFGTIDVGAQSTAQTVTVTVSGAAAAINAAVTGAGFVLNANSCASPQPIGSCTLSVVFAPSVVGLAGGTLTVNAATVSLTGKANPATGFTATPDRIDLGTLALNATAPALVTIAPIGAVTGLACVSSNTELAANAAQTTCAATGTVTAACVYAFTFTASTSGAHSDTITCNAAGKTTITTVVATVTPAVTKASIDISPKTQAFQATVGKTDVATFNVSNSGGSNSGTLNPTISAGATDFSILSHDCVVPLAPLAVCHIQVQYAPKAGGASTGTLTVADAAAGTSVTAALTGAAITGTAVTITPAGPVDFGSVNVAATSAATVFTVKNTGGTPTGLLALAGATTEFKIGNDLCTGVALAATTGQCTFSVTLTPAAAAATSALVTVSDSTGLLSSVKVTGTGTLVKVPMLALTPSSLDFGSDTGVGVTSAAQAFTVKNTGTADTAALSVIRQDSTSSVGGATEFPYTTTCTAVLAAGDSCQIVVKFQPTTAGRASATFTAVEGDPATSTIKQTATVTGIAPAKPGLTISCGTGVFADAVVGKTSTISCVVANAAASDQTTGALTFTATAPFSVGTTNCPATLDAGLSCLANLIFTPTTKGKVLGTATVTSVNKGASNVNLTGTGLGVVEIVEVTKIGTIVTPQPYDFGQVAVGSNTLGSAKSLTLAVFVRSSVGNMNVTGAFGSPANFTITDNATTATAITIGSTVVTGVAPCDSSTDPFSASRDVHTPACYKLVDFKPQTRTALTGTITAAGGDGTSDTATVKGSGTGPLTIAPSPADFGDVAKGSVGVVTITVTNNGPTSMKAFALTLAGANPDQFIVQQDGLSGTTLGGGGGHAEIVLGFNPTSVAAATATFSVTATVLDATGTNPVSTENAQVTLQGNGVVGANITATASGTFDPTFAGARDATTVTVTVSNAANALAATNMQIALQGGSDSDFLLTGPTVTTPAGTCWNLDSTVGLPGGQTCTIVVWFKPQTTSLIPSRTDVLTITTQQGGIATVVLSGTAKPQLSLTSSSATGDGSAATPYDFGTIVKASTTSLSTLTFTLTNHAETDVIAAPTLAIADSVIWPVANDALFSPIDTTGTGGCQVPTSGTNVVIAKNGGTCTFKITASDPAGSTAIKPLVEFKEIRAQVSGQIATAETMATVVMDASVQLSAKSLHSGSSATRYIGTVVLGKTSNPVTYTLINVGGTYAKGTKGVLTTHGSSTAAPSTTPFAIDPASSCLLTTITGEPGLAPGATCDFNIVYAPTSAHTLAATTDTDTVDLSAERIDLNITATNGIATTIVQTIAANRTTAGNVGYFGDSTANINAAVDMGAPAADGSFTAGVVIKNANSSGSMVLPAGFAVSQAIGPDWANPTTGIGTVTIATATTNGCAVGGTGVPAPSGTCGLTVTYAPVNASTPLAVGWHTILLSETGTATYALLAYVPGPASLNYAPGNTAAILALGSATSATSHAETVMVTNLGGTSTAISAITSSLPTNLLASGCSATTLAPLQSCTLTVTASPGATGVSGPGTVTLAASGLTGQTVVVGWTGTVDPALATTDTSSSYSFGKQAVLSTTATATTQQTFHFNNGLASPASRRSGPLSVIIAASATAGAAAEPDFSIVTSGGLSTCVTTDVALIGLGGSTDPDPTCTVTVLFSPLSLTTPAKTAYLILSSTSGGSTTPILMTGTAIPALSATAAVGTNVGTGNGRTVAADGSVTVSFGSVSTTATSTATEVITFTNEANAPMTGFLKVNLSDDTLFHVIDDQCTGVQLPSTPTGTVRTCTVTVTFVPAAASTPTATLTVSGTPGDSAVVTLKGTGII